MAEFGCKNSERTKAVAKIPWFGVSIQRLKGLLSQVEYEDLLSAL